MASPSRALSRGAEPSLVSVPRAVTRAEGHTRREDVLAFAAVCLPCLAVAAYLAFAARVYMGDAISRSYQAATVLYVDGFHLANLSFIWTPLPSVVQVPLVAIRPLAANGFAGQITSVACSAGTLVVLNRLLRLYLPARGWRYAILLAYQLHPLILLYAVNGMTEAMLLFWIVLGVYAMARMWREPEGMQLSRVAIMALSAAGAFLTRYEGVSFGIVLGAAVLIFTVAFTRPQRHFPERAEGYLLAFWAPWAYAICMWLYANWLIMGNPIYFMVGRGSNRDQAAALLASNREMAGLLHNVPGSIAYVTDLLLHVDLAFFPVVALLVVAACLWRDWYAAALALVIVSFPAFQVVLHVLGQSFGYARFHLYVVPLVTVGAVHLLRRGHLGFASRAAVLGLLVASAAAVLLAPLPATSQAWDGEPTYASLLRGQSPSPRPLAAQVEMGDQLRTLIQREPRARILADDLYTDAAIVFGDTYEHVLTSRNQRFQAALDHPLGNVDYLLVSSVEGDLIAPVLRQVQDPALVYTTASPDSRGIHLSLYRVTSG